MYGIYNSALVDTTPGAACAFAPMPGFSGNDNQYRALMRDRYKQRGYDQHMVVLAMQRKKGLELTFAGPYAALAKEIIDGIAAELSQQRASA